MVVFGNNQHIVPGKQATGQKASGFGVQSLLSQKLTGNTSNHKRRVWCRTTDFVKKTRVYRTCDVYKLNETVFNKIHLEDSYDYVCRHWAITNIVGFDYHFGFAEREKKKKKHESDNIREQPEVGFDHMTSKRYRVLIYTNQVSVCNCWEHWFTRKRGVGGWGM